MTVKELIEKLKELGEEKQEMPVHCPEFNCEAGCCTDYKEVKSVVLNFSGVYLEY